MRKLSEKQVLKKLNIPDFRHMTKDRIVDFTSMLHTMDPEVAKKALEQFPEFTNMASTMLAKFKEAIDKSFEDNSSSVSAYYAACNYIIGVLQEQLKKEELTSEERQMIINELIDIPKAMASKDTENKRFLKDMVTRFGIAAVSIAVIAVAALGVNANINLSDSGETD